MGGPKARRRVFTCTCAPVGEGVVAIFWRRQARAHVLRRASSCRLAFCANAQVWTRAQLRAGGKRARAMIGDGLSGGGGGVSPSKAMQTYKKKAGWQ